MRTGIRKRDPVTSCSKLPKAPLALPDHKPCPSPSGEMQDWLPTGKMRPGQKARRRQCLSLQGPFSYMWVLTLKGFHGTHHSLSEQKRTLGSTKIQPLIS